MSPSFHPALWLYRTLLNQSPLVFLKLSLPLGQFQKRYQYWKSIHLLNICETIFHFFFPPISRPAVVAPSQNVENVGKSPLLPSKLNTRTSFPTKAFSQDIPDSTPVFKVVIFNPWNAHFVLEQIQFLLRKTSHSESALDVTYQNAMAQQVEAESGQDENVSTDSSLPSNDDESRKLKKKQRFQFPSFVKRNKNKTWWSLIN